MSTQAYTAFGEASRTTSSDLNPNTAANPIAYAIDPALQIFLKDASWDNTIFEGLQGFPSTLEPEPSYYDFANPSGISGDRGYAMLESMDLEPT
jgi:hypothetical protein